MTFKIGDRVRVVESHMQPQLVGEITTVIGIDNASIHPFETSLGVDELGGWCYPASSLELIDDGNETVSWESCIWQPQKVTVLAGESNA